MDKEALGQVFIRSTYSFLTLSLVSIIPPLHRSLFVRLSPAPNYLSSWQSRQITHLRNIPSSQCWSRILFIPTLPSTLPVLVCISIIARFVCFLVDTVPVTSFDSGKNGQGWWPCRVLWPFKWRGIWPVTSRMRVTIHTQSRTRTAVADSSNMVHILHRNCLPKRVTDGKIERTRRRWRRHKKSRGGNEKRRYCELEEESLWSHSVANPLCGRLWTCNRRDYVFGTETAVSPC
jgi:hypothetical protein